MDLTLAQYCKRVNTLAVNVGVEARKVAALHFYYLHGFTPVEAVRALSGKKKLTIPADLV
jgi:hypothetical protein